MTYEMRVPLDTAAQGVAKALLMAGEDGYITTKTMSDILKPVDMSTYFIISELAWWYYEELHRNIKTIIEPITKPGQTQVIITFPKYHTGPVYGLFSKEETSFDVVSHPSHYTEGRKYEPRKVIADWGLNFNLGNAVKYISRAGRKGDKIEDLRKAIQYIEFEIEELDPNYMSSENHIMKLKKRLNAVYGMKKEDK